MKKVNKVLRYLFGSKTFNHDYQVWAKTEYGNDWQYAYYFILPKISKKGKDLNK